MALFFHDVEPGYLDEHFSEESVTKRKKCVYDPNHLVHVRGVGHEVAPPEVEERRLADREDIILGGRVGEISGVVAPGVTEDVPVRAINARG